MKLEVVLIGGYNSGLLGFTDIGCEVAHFGSGIAYFSYTCICTY